MISSLPDGPARPLPTYVAVSSDTGGALRSLREMMLRCATVASGLTLYYFFLGVVCAGSECGTLTLRIAHTAGLGALIVAFVLLALRPLRHDPTVVFTPAFAYVVSTALFFGFGSLSTFMVDDGTQRFVLAGNYHIDERGLLRTSALTMAGSAILLLSMMFSSKLRIGRTRRSNKRLSVMSVALVFLSLGLVIKFAFILPSRWGITTWVVPGAFANLAQLADIGFALLSYTASRGGRGSRLLFWLLWPPYLSVTVLEFAKTATMFAILLPAIGAYLAHRRIIRFISWLMMAALAFGVMQNINTSARIAVVAHGGEEDKASFDVRLQILIEEIWKLGRQATYVSQAPDAPAMWWVRLNYSGPQLRAMELYDSGVKADWEVSPLSYIVPRLLWPEKPVVTSPGLMFNRLVSYNETTMGRVAITVYAEGYWFAGWLGVGIFSCLTGLILGLITRQTYNQLSARNFIFLPAAFLGMQMGGMGVNGFFQTNILGALPIYLAYIAMTSAAMVMLKAGQRNERDI